MDNYNIELFHIFNMDINHNIKLLVIIININNNNFEL